MLLSAIVGVLVLAAGVAILAVLATIGVHDALKRFHHDVLALDTAFAIAFGAQGHEERSKHGVMSFFLIAWAIVVAFFILRQIPSFAVITHGSALVSAGFFGLGLYLALMLVFLPIFRLGAFGRGHHRLVPYWGAFFVAVFVAVASVLVAIVI
jgi:hypothetical protein